MPETSPWAGEAVVWLERLVRQHLLPDPLAARAVARAPLFAPVLAVLEALVVLRAAPLDRALALPLLRTAFTEFLETYAREET